jgi:hypothetical protein
MAFRRDGKSAHAHTRDWREWLERHSDLLRASGLPPQVLRTRKDWDYLLRYGYHGYPQIDFQLEELTADQRAAFRRLLEVALSSEARRHGNAGWHFVCPPGSAD